MMRAYPRFWLKEPHPLTETIRKSKNRTYQVWECNDEGVIYFVIAAPEVTAYTDDGRPFQFSHVIFSIDYSGDPIDWPLIETLDRPLEVRYKRLA